MEMSTHPMYELLGHRVNLDKVISASCLFGPWANGKDYKINILFERIGPPLIISGDFKDIYYYPEANKQFKDERELFEKEIFIPFTKAWKKNLNK